MVNVSNVSLQFGARVLFKDVNLKFTKGNCYGIIGANGAGKSTFLRILTGELEPNKGEVTISSGERMSVLKQNQNAYDEHTVLETVLMGYERLIEVERLKNELYSKPDFSEEDGLRAAELEQEYMDMGGWEADGNAKTKDVTTVISEICLMKTHRITTIGIIANMLTTKQDKIDLMILCNKRYFFRGFSNSEK